MTTRAKSDATKFMESLCGPLTFGDHLDFWRYSYEISQADCARKLGITRAQLCDIEKGRRLVSPAMAAKFARILGEDESLFVELATQDQFRRAGLRYAVNVTPLDAKAAKPKAAKQARRPTPARERLAAAG